MIIGLSLYFKHEFNPKTFYVDLFYKFVKFTPSVMTYKNKQEVWNEQKWNKIIKSYHSGEHLSVAGQNFESFFTIIPDRDKTFRCVDIKQDIMHFNPSDVEIEQLSDYDEFIAGYLYNDDYEVVQSTPNESNYKGRVISAEIIKSNKSTPYDFGVFGGKVYKTEFNPGRTVQLKEVDLMVSWKSWFGSNFYKWVQKEKISSFPYATSIDLLPNDRLFVQLYDDVEKPYTTESVFKQWKWREWLDYDGLEAKFKL